MSLLAVRQLEVAYSRVVTAVEGVSIDVAPGTVVALLGTNGAGKTTTLRAISGFIGLDDASVTDGSISFGGARIENRPPHRIARLGIALVPERDKVFESLSVAENLEVAVAAPGARQEELRDRVWSFFPRLFELRARQAGYLSGGERQMLAMGSALMCGPRLLLVDEMSLGLAPIVTEQLMERLAQIRRELGVAVLLVEQNAALALDIADHGYVIENGRIVLEGTPARLKAHGDVQEFYLGQSGAGRRSYRAVKQYRRSRRWYG